MKNGTMKNEFEIEVQGFTRRSHRTLLQRNGEEVGDQYTAPMDVGQ